MSTHVGEVEIYVDLDGRRLPVQTKRLAEDIGKALDGEFKGLSRRLDGVSTDLDRVGSDLERAFTLDDIGNLRQVYETFDEIDAGARRAAIGTGAFRDEYDGIVEDIGELHQVRDGFDDIDGGARRASGGMRELGASLEDTGRKGESTRRSMSHLGDLLRMMGGGNGPVERLSAALDNNSLRWSNLGHETRQWTLIIAAVAAGMQEISVLGSAAGAGLLAVGGAGLSLVSGVGAAAAVFVTLGKELDELPPSLRPVVAEFQEFKGVFGELRNLIAEGAFRQMPGVFTSLDRTVRGLSPRFYDLGSVVGRLLDDLATNVRPGTEAFKQLDRSLQLAEPNFDSLARSSGTLGLALIRGFNRAQPLVQDLTGYVDKLVGRFDAFTQSNSFDDWISRSQRVFGSFGGLLDATGRALNDLVTPAAINRTTLFLDNLTGFMPSLSQLLDTLGRLDAFGLLAQLLNDFGAALEPLEGPVGDLAEALSGKLSTGISTAADTLGLLATAAAPVVQALADLVDAVPDDVMAGLVISLAIASGAFAVFRGAAGIAGAVSAMATFAGAAATTLGASKTLASGLSAGIGRAGLIGGIAAGFALAASAAGGFEDAILQVDDKSRNLVASSAGIKRAYEDLGVGIGGTSRALTDVSGALDGLASVGTQRFTNIFGFVGAAFTDTGNQALQLARALEGLDSPIASLANQNLPAAQKQFSQWATELGATDSQVLNLINQMPKFKQALIDTAAASGQAATDQDLIALALGRTAAGADVAAGAASRLSGGMMLANGQVVTTDAALALLEGRSYSTGTAVDDLANKIRGFGSATLDVREANRQFEEALDAVTAAVEANGTTLDIATAAGRANEAALDAVAQKALNAAAAALEQSGSQDQATAAIGRGRDELRQMLGQFGITGQAAEDYINRLGLVPENVETAVRLDGVSSAEGALNNLARTRNAVIRVTQEGGGYNNSNLPRPFASGGMLYGPEIIYAGEAGQEAVVPMDRPLHDVDPSVRMLSAFAQGKLKLPSGGESRPTRVFEEGAIVVKGSLDPRRTAIEVQRAITEDALS